MRIFGSDRISGLMQKLGMEEGVPIEHGMVTRAIERAQKQVEAQNFSVRKHLLEYDDVMNKQRENIYALRRQILEGKIRLQDEEGEETALGTREYLMELAEDILDALVETYAPRKADFEQWDLDALKREVDRVFAIDTGDARLQRPDVGRNPRHALGRRSSRRTRRRKSWSAARCSQRVERDIMLQIVDSQWKDHLYSLDHLKEGIGLRGYGQRDPLVEYKKESFAALPGDEGARRRGDRPLPLVAAADARTTKRAGRRAAPAGAAPRAADPQRSRRRSRSQSALGGAAGAGAAAPSPFGAAARQQQPPRVGGDDAVAEDGAARRAEGRPQRPVPVRQREEIQEMPRSRRVTRITVGTRIEPMVSLRSGPEDSTVDTRLSTEAGLATALTFDDILLVPRHSTVVPTQVDVSTRLTRNIRLNVPLRQRGDGHRHRVAAGDRDGAAGRPRRHPQEPVDRRTGVGSRSREAVGERHDRRSDHALPRQPDLRSARPDEEIQHLRRADHRGRQQGRPPGRHPHEPRPALRDQRQPRRSPT